MKIKLDENLPDSLARALSELGHDADTVMQEGLQGSPDDQVWAAAVREDRFLITQDVGLADPRLPNLAQSAGLLLIRIEQDDYEVLAARVLELFRTEETETWRGCIVSATLRKIRVHRPR